MMTMGCELPQVIEGGSWLDLIVVGNIFIPDPEGNFRVGATIGVNWQ
jgi:hypothetical protein